MPDNKNNELNNTNPLPEIQDETNQAAPEPDGVAQSDSSSENAASASAEKADNPAEIRKKRLSLSFYAGGILLIALGLILISYIGQLRVNSTLEAEKVKSFNDAKNITAKYNTLLTDYDALKTEAEKNDALITALTEQLKQLESNANTQGAALAQKNEQVTNLTNSLSAAQKQKAAAEAQALLSLTYRKENKPYKSCRAMVDSMEEKGYSALLNTALKAEFDYIKSKIK